MHRTHLAAWVAGLFTLPALAQETVIPTLDEIVVTATRIPTPDVLAPYSSEVHTRKQIEQSGAASLYDYLARHTSVNVMPNYGNRFTPLLDMRGYGFNGGQNMVVTVDGLRLNNIDGLPQLMGAIPLTDIERIEITKGSGSVMFGDGAAAGSIQIITRAHQGVGVAAETGNYGARAVSAAAGLGRDNVKLSVSGLYDHVDGYAEADVTGHKDASTNRTWRGTLEVKPLAVLDMGLDLASTRIDTRYPGPLTLAELQANPAQNSGNTYSHQALESDLWRVRGSVQPAPAWRLNAAHAREDKRSHYLSPFPFKADYDTISDDLALQYRGETLDLTAGLQRSDGVRISRNGFGDNDTHKKNTAVFAQGQLRLGHLAVSAGARRENVAYRYVPTAGATIAAEHDLAAWNLGINQDMGDGLTLFASYDRAFTAPNIDSFFADTNGDFIPDAVNLNIQPTKSRTLTLGLNHVTAGHRLKASVFYARLEDELYYNPTTFTNTNLDKTHKYGLEVQDSWRATETLSASVNYTWTRAVIDTENDGGGAFNGKDLPGVSRHGVVLGLNWQPADHWRFNLDHTWRSQAYAAEDFANTFTQKQAAYQSTGLGLRYQRKNLEWTARVDNLFEHTSGLWIRNDAIYAVDFARTWRVGLKARF